MVMLAGLLAAATLASAGTDAKRPPIAPQDLVELAEIMGPTLSPDGRRVAYRLSRASIADNQTRLEWYVVGVDGGKPVHIGSGGVARFDGGGLIVEQAPVWDADSHGLRFLALADGAVSIWHWRDGGTARAEIVDDADILDFASYDNGQAISYTVGASRTEVEHAEQRAYEAGTLVDASVDLNQAAAGGMIEDGKRIMLRFNGPWFDRKRILWDAPRTERKVELNAAHLPTAQVPSVADQGSVASRRTGDVARIADSGGVIVTRRNGATVQCAAAACVSPDLAVLGWLPFEDALLLFEEQGSAREKVWLWRVGTKRARAIATTDGALRVPGRPPRCAIGRDALFCAESLPLTPPRLVRIDYRTGARRTLAEPNKMLAGRIRAEATAFSLDGRYSAMLLRPLRFSAPLPLVVQNYHCGGFLKGGTGEELPMLPLVERGIAILCIDPFFAAKESGMEESYQLALEVISKALDSLAAQRIIDPARVGIAGFSHSSGVALWGLRHSKRFAAATIGTGQISPYYYWSNALPDRGFTTILKHYWGVGDPETDAARWRLASAVWDASAIDTPLLMQLPDAEAPWTAELHTRLKRAGRPAEMFVYADELHNKYQPVHKLAVHERNLDWFRFWLTREEDPSPDKSQQYARWRQLRAEQSLPAPSP